MKVETESLNLRSSLIFNEEVSRPLKRRKIIILGSPGVGKSAMIMRFKDDIFLEYYEPTIQNIIKKTLVFQGENVELEIFDLDGQTEYTIFSFSKLSFGIHGYILCYSIENRQSFELLKIIHAKLINLVGRDIPKVLVANKYDLNNKREISFEEGKELARKMNCPFIECSAKSNDNINKAFHLMLIEIEKYENNVDFRGIGCSKLLEFFAKREQSMTILFYILIVLNTLLGSVYLTYGFYTGIISFINNTIMVGVILLIGLWNIIFTILGVYGLIKKNKEFLNYHSIGLIISIIVKIFSVCLHLLIIDNDSVEILVKLMKNQFFCIFVPSTIIFEGLILFISIMFQKVYKYDLPYYYMD